MSYEIKEVKGNKITVEIDVIDPKKWNELPTSEKGNQTIATSSGMQPMVFNGKVVKFGFNILYKELGAKQTK